MKTEETTNDDGGIIHTTEEIIKTEETIRQHKGETNRNTGINIQEHKYEQRESEIISKTHK